MNRPKIIRAEKFVVDVQTPIGMKFWPDEKGLQPRDCSFGYIDTLMGRKHIQEGDWVLVDNIGNYYVRHWDPFDIFNPLSDEDLCIACNGEGIIAPERCGIIPCHKCHGAGKI